MNSIQWFPGHMKKTLKDIQNNLKFVDCVLVILDARIPFSSMNFELLNLLNNKPVLVLFNKSFLVNLKENAFFVDYFNKKNINTLNIDAKARLNIEKIYPKIQDILKKNNRRIKKTLKFMIVGAPNVGKSTLINCLSKRKIAKTANLPGITRQMQWFHLTNNIMLLDTPGCLWPKFKYQEIGYSLSICGCIKENLLLKEEIVVYFLNYLKKHYPVYLRKLFNLNQIDLQKENLLQTILDKINISQNSSSKMDNLLLSFIFNKIKNNLSQKINYDLDLKYLF
ncbi:ribosome biogenesis GTPase YlqF ['Camptotheca acuminata' phytoplasma]|uniref:ribosome biogenesis GTPase YlqF n=1 Tax='Camptotheca acuminata' phytoplasma TaxID=3239192 RepID=UPI003519E400